MALLDWANGDLFSALRDKVNAIRAAASSFAGGTIGQIWTKDSSTDFNGSFKNATVVIESGLPAKAGMKRYILAVKEDESAYELYQGLASEVNIDTRSTGYQTVSTTTFATLNNGSGTSLTYTLPNDSNTRRLLIMAFPTYENGFGDTSGCVTRIASNGTALRTGFKDLRNQQDEFPIMVISTIICTGQVITVDAKKNAGGDSSFTFNGGILTISELI
jgi:hypothetical protein